MSEQIQNDEFLTKRELARLCRCSERTIDRLLEGGETRGYPCLRTAFSR
jgi:hypothetical protein